MSITLVDINDLAATVSKDTGILFAVDVPSGGGFIQAKLSKADLFKLLLQAIDHTTSAGGNTFLSFDGPTGNRFIYVNNGSTGVIIAKFGTFGVSADGATNIIQMEDSGLFTIGTSAVNGQLRMREGGTTYDWTAQDIEHDVFADLAIANAGTSDAKQAVQSLMYIEVAAAGTIATHTINFPTTPKVGYVFEVTLVGTITTLTMASAVTISNPLTTMANENAKWVYVVTGGGAGTPSWRRMV